MAILIDCLRSRQNNLSELVSKGQYAPGATFAQDFAVVNKDCASPLAIYADSAAKLDRVSEREGISHWILSTENMDREGDCLVASGCLSEIEPFRKNPIVDYDHRRFHVLPIGKSVGDGNLPVIVTQNKQVVAGCKHHAETQFADEVARLVFKGLLNGCSVAFVPVVGERMTLKSYGGEKAPVTPRYKFSKWQITAWSICPVGINPEATRMELSMGWMKSPELIKSLTPYAETPKAWAPGWTSEDNMKSFEEIDKAVIGAIRFHKSKFADEASCQEWLREKSLDGSAMVANEKSTDFLQEASCELDTKTDKVGDGVYVVYKKRMKTSGGEMSFDDVRSQLNAMIAARFGKDAWVHDVFPTHVVYQLADKWYSLGYSSKDGALALADATPALVVRETVYTPVVGKSESQSSVVMKALPFKKKKGPDEEEEKPQASKKPPFQGKKPAAKPGMPANADAEPDDDDELHSDNPDDTKATDDEVEGRDEEQEKDASDPSPDVPDVTDPTDQSGDDDNANSDDAGMDQSGAPTYAGQAAIDVAKHKAAELEFYKQSLAAHDHDGLKVMMTQAMRNCQRDYDQWMAGAKRLFPNIDFDSLTKLDSEDNEEGLQDDSAGPGSVEQEPLAKSVKTISEEDWELVAVKTAFMF